jgi:hypothetical protein
MKEASHAKREASGGLLEGRSREKGFSEVTGGRAPSFRDLSVGEASRPRGGTREPRNERTAFVL